MQDWWAPTYYDEFRDKTALNPSGPSFAGTERVLRGDECTLGAPLCRATYRDAYAPSNHVGTIGFRMVLAVGSMNAAIANPPKGGAKVTIEPVKPTDIIPAQVSSMRVSRVDRLAAEQTLGLGGSVAIKVIGETKERAISHVSDLSEKPFFVMGIFLDNPKSPIMDTDLELFRGLKDMTSLRLAGPKITDRGIELLSEIGTLRVLSLFGNGVTASGMAKHELFCDCRLCVSFYCRSCLAGGGRSNIQEDLEIRQGRPDPSAQLIHAKLTNAI